MREGTVDLSVRYVDELRSAPEQLRSWVAAALGIFREYMSILSERSPLVYIPDALEPQQKRSLQAIRYSIEFIETSFERLRHTIEG